MTGSRLFTCAIFQRVIPITILLWATNIRAQTLEDPDPVIIANNSTGVVNLTTTDDLYISIELDPHSSSGVSADWWIVVDTPMGFYYYAAELQTWMPGIVAYQTPLIDFEPVEILDISSVPAGSYTFYFGVDTIPNGELDEANLFYSSVIVEVTEASAGDFSMLSPYINASDIRSIWPFSDETHRGLDFATNIELIPFRAAAAGIVENVELSENEFSGNWQVDVTIKFNETYSTFYAFEPFTTNQSDGETQLANITVSPGQSVAPGDIIGSLYTAGAPGMGAHVHFGLFIFIPDGADPTECPEPYFTESTNLEILEIIQIEHPEAAVCNP